MDLKKQITEFACEDVGGFLITDEDGTTLYEDEVSKQVDRRGSNWAAACPPRSEGQKGEEWDLIDSVHEKAYKVITSTVPSEGKLLQFHFMTDVTLYTDIFKKINEYSRSLKEERDHDHLTGLYNKGKFMEMKRKRFRDLNSIAVFNLDVNNLKYMNDTFGHEAGDKLIKKAAESFHRVSSRNVMCFRMGGDEFAMVGMGLSRDEADQLKKTWEDGLAELNQEDDGINCVIACGMVWGEKEYDLEELLEQADKRMYEDKLEKKAKRTGPEANFR